MPELYPTRSDAPAGSAAAITPDNSTDLTDTTRAIYVGTAGDLTVDMEDDGTNVTFQNVPVGILPIRVTRVYATGTGASDLVALW